MIRVTEVIPSPSHPITEEIILDLKINIGIEIINKIKTFENIIFFSI